MKISEIITDKYKLRIPHTVYYDLLADVREAEEEQEPCEDAISRQAVLEQINCWIGSGEYRHTNATDYLCKRIKAISSVNPQKPICPSAGVDCEDCPAYEPKTGHWISGKYRDTCSACRCTYPKKMGIRNFCPACGVRMAEEVKNG